MRKNIKLDERVCDKDPGEPHTTDMAGSGGEAMGKMNKNSDRKSGATAASKLRIFSTDRIRQIYRDLPNAKKHTDFQFTARDALVENLQNFTNDFPYAFRTKQDLLAQVEQAYEDIVVANPGVGGEA